MGVFAIAWSWLRSRRAAPAPAPAAPNTAANVYPVTQPGSVQGNPHKIDLGDSSMALPFTADLVNSFFSMGQPAQAAAPRVGSFGWSNFDDFARSATELDVLARTLFGEAAGESRRGIEAVAAVVMNRVADRRWPNTARAVCLQNRQYSLWNVEYRDTDANSLRALSVTDTNSAFKVCLAVAQDALAERLVDPTGGAHHYYNPRKASPAWAPAAKSSLTIGNHIFLVGVP